MAGGPQETPEEKRARKAAEERARRDRIVANEQFLTDRTSELRRQFGLVPGNIGGRPSMLGPASVAIRSLGASLLLSPAARSGFQKRLSGAASGGSG